MQNNLFFKEKNQCFYIKGTQELTKNTGHLLSIIAHDPSKFDSLSILHL